MSLTTRLDVAALQLPGKVWVGEAPREPVRRLGSGVAELDRLLGGGLPRGDVSEIVGGRTSGRTAIAWALLAASTRGGEVVAVVDLPDALHPASLADGRLERVLWVRPPNLRAALKSAELILDAGGFGAVLLDLDTPAVRRFPGHVWPRLRRDARNSGAALIILSPHELAGSFAAVRIALAQKQVLWPRRVFGGVRVELLPQRSVGAGMPGGAMIFATGHEEIATDEHR